ncbi:hypothetical protein PUR61_03425 [Streptomyces sp. BE20]|uniref:hypothetical protein n=1 Tax=Streptomyces sp. BE20 TaxID=3002525 RepID=UPI002E7A738F|nr:hypothetical protein [Streptomyces sp. BE20]MEE1821254.1 hypothetical protein [Streptomyces sp. BE20]
MTTQPDRQAPTPSRPAALNDLRTGLSRYGLPGDRERFEQDLAAALDAVTEVIATYRDRLTPHNNPEAMAALAAPIGEQQWTPAGEAFARIRAAAEGRQPRPGDAVRENTEITSRFATQAELDALGYTGDVIVTQSVRTTVRADGTPIGKTLTIQGGSTPIVRWLDPADLDPDEF